ncbi:MAG: cyclase family protein [Blastocatellia bacterium]|nr:cyclase family protein [Blastocatellia bacterium]
MKCVFCFFSVFVLLAGFQLGAQTGTEPPGTWVDLTHDFSKDTIYWPTSDPFQFETVAEGQTAKGYYYSAYKFCAAEHGGTHLDAPIHFAAGHQTADQIPLNRLIGTAVKVDVSAKCAENRDYLIGIEDLKSWEAKNGRFPAGSILLLETGFSKYWPDRVKYLGTDKRGPEGVAALHFPGLHPDAARWLVKNRKIKAVGLDTASIDYGQSSTFDSHVVLLGENIPVFENVAHLELVPAKGARVVALPMKIKGGSGGPLRIVAFVPAKK